MHDKRAATFHRGHVPLSTVNDRLKCAYVLPDNAESNLIDEYLLNDDYEFRTSTLQYDRFADESFLHARLRRTTDEH